MCSSHSAVLHTIECRFDAMCAFRAQHIVSSVPSHHDHQNHGKGRHQSWDVLHDTRVSSYVVQGSAVVQR